MPWVLRNSKFKLNTDQTIIDLVSTVLRDRSDAFDELELVSFVHVTVLDEAFQVNTGVWTNHKGGSVSHISAIDPNADECFDSVEVFDEEGILHPVGDVNRISEFAQDTLVCFDGERHFRFIHHVISLIERPTE